MIQLSERIQKMIGCRRFIDNTVIKWKSGKVSEMNTYVCKQSLGDKLVTDYRCNLGTIRLLPPHQASAVTLAGYYTADRDVIRPETDKTKSFSPLTHLALSHTYTGSAGRSALIPTERHGARRGMKRYANTTITAGGAQTGSDLWG